MATRTPPCPPAFLRTLLAQLDEEMVLRGFTRDTRRLYLAHVRRFYSGREGVEVHEEEIRSWLLDLLRTGRSHSFANQALSAEYLAKSAGKLENRVYEVPKAFDHDIARLKLKALSVRIDDLNEDQQSYLSSWESGT